MAENETVFQMTPEIAGAVCKVMGQVKQLGKTEKNKFDNYDFVSVDKFLAAVNPLCADAGLFVIHQEIGHDYYTNKKESLWMRVSFDFYLCHTSGHVCGPFRRCVAVPMTGAQSYGSAQSYALKQFFRALFMIPTGDRDDADFNTKDEHQAAPQKYTPREDWTVDEEPGLATGVKGAKADPNASPAEKAKSYADQIIKQFWEAKRADGVEGVWRKNEAVIERLKANYEPMYQDVLSAYEARLNAIKEDA